MIDPVYSVEPSASTPDGTATERLRERIERCVKDVSLGFERWDDPQARGPGLYFLVVGCSDPDFVAPMGTNRWPVEDCASVFDDIAELLAAAAGVAVSEDGAIVVHDDGTIEPGMVRVDQLPRERRRRDELSYADWMGARHMSALETSTREDVIAAITLSEEDGRVTVFTDGTFEDSPVESLEVE